MTRQMDILPVEGHEFQWTRRWFLNRNGTTFREFIHPEFAGEPTVYLELGVFEGMSMVWMLQHVLNHPDSRAVGVDPWLMTRKLSEDAMSKVMGRAFSNVDPWGWSGEDKCRLVRGNSAEVLRKMQGEGFAGIKRNTVDLSMVDGNHNALAVLDDLRLVHRLVKPGGWILLDDVENRISKGDHVKEGLAMFLEEQPMEMVWKHRFCECYRK